MQSSHLAPLCLSMRLLFELGAMCNHPRHIHPAIPLVTARGTVGVVLFNVRGTIDVLRAHLNKQYFFPYVNGAEAQR